MIKQYELCNYCDTEEFEERVRECIALGFQPYGNLVTTYLGKNCEGDRIIEYCQAMVKYEN